MSKCSLNIKCKHGTKDNGEQKQFMHVRNDVKHTYFISMPVEQVCYRKFRENIVCKWQQALSSKYHVSCQISTAKTQDVSNLAKLGTKNEHLTY